MTPKNEIEREELLYQIAAWDFRKTDLALFLDTHPYDVQAIMMFEEANYQSAVLKNMYETSYGPLISGTTCSNYWNWIDSPWPWEAER